MGDFIDGPLDEWRKRFRQFRDRGCLWFDAPHRQLFDPHVCIAALAQHRHVAHNRPVWRPRNAVLEALDFIMVSPT
jgi:hypothetical protein